MVENLSKEVVINALEQDAGKIRRLIGNQKNHLCIAQCKAFEEVVDTQMFGFSKEVDFAVRIGVISEQEGQSILLNLEQELNDLYSQTYDVQKGQEG